jgi:hypothetical protein
MKNPIFFTRVLLALTLWHQVVSAPPNPTTNPKTSNNTNSTLPANQTSSSNNTNPPTPNPPTPKPKLKSGKPQVVCHKDVIESYGLRAVKYSHDSPMDMCGPMKLGSCCEVQSQIQMFALWNEETRSTEMKSKFKEYQDIYENHLNTLSVVSDTSIKLNDKILFLNNCKILTQTINKFKMKEALPKLKEITGKAMSLWEDFYKGFYCGICDGENQKHIDPSRKTLQISAEFCWSVVNTSLPFLIYYNNHFETLTNIMTEMESWCDADGNFKFKQISNHLKLSSDPAIKNSIFACNANLNTPQWLAHCMPICQKVSFVNFPSIFRPNMRGYERITKYLKNQNKKFEPPAAPSVQTPSSPAAANKTATPAPANKTADNGVSTSPANAAAPPTDPPAAPKRSLRGRKLASKFRKMNKQKASLKITKISNKQGIDRYLKNEKTENEEERLSNVANMYFEADSEPIIVGMINRKVKLEDFKIKVSKDGLNFVKSGKETKFTQEAFNSVKALMKINAQNGVVAGQTNVRVKSAKFITHAFACLTALLLLS